MGNIQDKKAKGIRSKAKWIEFGEKNWKYFLNLEKRNYANKYFKKIITENTIVITKPKEILKEQANHYQNLYNSKFFFFLFIIFFAAHTR